MHSPFSEAVPGGQDQDEELEHDPVNVSSRSMKPFSTFFMLYKLPRRSSNDCENFPQRSFVVKNQEHYRIFCAEDSLRD